MEFVYSSSIFFKIPANFSLYMCKVPLRDSDKCLLYISYIYQNLLKGPCTEFQVEYITNHKSLDEYCTKQSNCKLAAFWISVLQESKNYCKLDAMFALKSLGEYCTKCLNSKFTEFWILVLHLSKRYCKLNVMYALNIMIGL